MTMKPLQPGQKPSVLCNSLRACLPAHICVDDHNYFFVNMFLSLLPPSTRAQCLAAKISKINKLVCFADHVTCQIPAASALAVVELTLSANAASSLMSLIFVARHCALVDGGSSERNLFRK